jgi:hypothetical protein
LPILVFEGLPEPRLDQSETELVESILEKSVKLPRASVRTALRLPITQTNGKSIVIVEMDTMEHEDTILKQKNDIRREKNPNLDKLGIRRAKYKELWKLVEELTVVKRVVSKPVKPDSIVQSEADEISQIFELDRNQFETEAEESNQTEKPK